MPRPKHDPSNDTGALISDRPDGKRRITLRQSERNLALRSRLIEGAAALFLDLEHPRSWPEIATELGITPGQLSDLVKTPEFDAAYNALFADIGHDPRYKAAQTAMADLLPIALRELKLLISGVTTNQATRLKAIEIVLKMNSLSLEKPAASEKQELAQFLVNNQVVVQNLPPQYAAALQGTVVEGEIVQEAED